ncbi:hypothetical protein LTR78_010744 [Recurvomyces mirabilis]|uniref:Uncharacterized protein n=1 Tax=Recurvomyces mirabilis TaxID=574656 RepID=A0AAE0TRH8_9PEZI|nr:hypothetical protein LTR78_010744 [Recurvomyces mirabilis]KAK5155581.1 hypothetical protein LTS14_005842 [Recurvomyces mirabilis]
MSSAIATAITPRSLIIPLIHVHPDQARLLDGNLRVGTEIRRTDGALLLKPATSFTDLERLLLKQIDARFEKMSVGDRIAASVLVLPGREDAGTKKKVSGARRDGSIFVTISDEQRWEAARPMLLEGKAELVLWFTQQAGGFDVLLERLKADMLLGPTKSPLGSPANVQEAVAEVKIAWTGLEMAMEGLLLWRKPRTASRAMGIYADVEADHGKQRVLSEKQVCLMRY